MIRNLLGYCLIFLTTAVFGQLTVSIEPNPVHGSGSPYETDIKATAIIINNSDVEVNLMWKRAIIEAPDGWWSWVCDKNVCYGPEAFENPVYKPNVLAPNESMTFEVHVRPFNIQGIAHLNFEFYDLSDTTTILSVVESTFETSTTATTLDPHIAPDLRIYPNPATSYFRVFHDDAVARIILYDMVGNQVIDFKSNDGGQYDISNLPQGMYFAKMFATDQSVIKTVRLSKR